MPNFFDFTLLRRGKRKDYFTGALPWPQKGSAVSLSTTDVSTRCLSAKLALLGIRSLHRFGKSR